MNKYFLIQNILLIYFIKNFKLFNNLKNKSINNFDLYARTTQGNLISYLILLNYDWLHQFKLCIDIIVYNKPGKRYQFIIVYYLLSLTYNARFQLLVQTSILKGLQTINIIYKSAKWNEREVWDIFGIFIVGHNDLRRLLTDYGFEGFPLRKDFPLTGYKEIVYNDFTKIINYRFVELIQDFRTYFFNNPW